MSGNARVSLAGSERTAPAGLTLTGPADPAERIEVTIVTRRSAALPRNAASRSSFT